MRYPLTLRIASAVLLLPRVCFPLGLAMPNARATLLSRLTRTVVSVTRPLSIELILRSPYCRGLSAGSGEGDGRSIAAEYASAGGPVRVGEELPGAAGRLLCT